MFAQVPTPTTTAVPAGTTPSTQPRENIQGAVQSSEFLFYSALLALILLAAGGLFYFIDRWRKAVPERESEREASLSISSFRELYENGEITESEYQRVRDKLAARLKVVPGGSSPVQASNPLPGEKVADTTPPKTGPTPPDASTGVTS